MCVSYAILHFSATTKSLKPLLKHFYTTDNYNSQIQLKYIARNYSLVNIPYVICADGWPTLKNTLFILIVL